MKTEDEVRADERTRWVRWHERRIREWTATRNASDSEEVEAACDERIAAHTNAIHALRAGDPT